MQRPEGGKDRTGVWSTVCEGAGWWLRLVRWARARHSEPLGPAKNSGLDFQSNEHPLKQRSPTDGPKGWRPLP